MSLHVRIALSLCMLPLVLTGCPKDEAAPSEESGGLAGSGTMDLGPNGGDPPGSDGMGSDGSSPGTEPPAVDEPVDPGEQGSQGPSVPGGAAGAGSGNTPPDAMTDPDSEPTRDGPPCGSRGLALCGDGELCDFPESAACGEADAPGTCEPMPSACTKELREVCGCDGSTYGNGCMARAAGVSVRHAGACGTDGEPGGGDSGAMCGGLTGLACPDDQFCDFPPDVFCGAADGLGTCRTLPELCTAIYDPVCGCDGNTYGSACSAAAAGVSVASEGEC